MARKRADPVKLWRAWTGLSMLAFEAQSVVGMRMLGMSGLWPVSASENDRMLSEKPPAFVKASMAVARKAATGASPDQLVAAAVKPLTKVARANRKRLVKNAMSPKPKRRSKS